MSLLKAQVKLTIHEIAAITILRIGPLVTLSYSIVFSLTCLQSSTVLCVHPLLQCHHTEGFNNLKLICNNNLTSHGSGLSLLRSFDCYATLHSFLEQPGWMDESAFAFPFASSTRV